MPPTSHPLGLDDLSRLASLSVVAALASFMLVMALLAATVGMGGAMLPVWLGVVVLAHGWFIGLITDYGLRLRFYRSDPGESDVGEAAEIAFRAAVPLAIPLGAATAAFWYTQDLRWSLAGWVVLVVTELPARVVCWLRGRRIRFGLVGVRLTLAAAALALIELPGLPIQTCDDCWGFMDGGIVALPLLGAHLFLASTTAALLSVFAVHGVAPVGRDA